MIKQTDIDKIVESCRIEEVVGDFVHLTKRGVNYIGLCPFHNEKTPSFIVSPAKGICKCFGCGQGGDAVAFVMKHEHYSYADALRYLAKKYLIEIKEEVRTKEDIERYNEQETLYSVLAYAKDYFIETMFKTEEGLSHGLKYFEEREFSMETIKKFQLGYCSQDRDLFTQNALRNGYKVTNLEKAGLTIVKENNQYLDRFRQRVIFPIHNFSGKVIGFGARVLTVGKVDKMAKYVNTPETDVYHKSNVLYGIFLSKTPIKQKDKCFLVEGYTDVISFHQVGIENVVASSGTSLTVGQIRLIKRLTDNITIIYDGDNAGIKAALRGVSLVLQEGMNVRVVLLPPNDDPDSFAKSHSLEECENYIAQQEQSFIEFKAALLVKEVGNDPIKKAELLNQIAADIALIPDLMTRTTFTQQCSRLLDVSEQVLATTIAKLLRKAYFDRKKKEKEQNSEIPASEQTERTEQEQYMNAAGLPVEPLERNFAVMSIDEVERHLLYLIFNYGRCAVYLSSENSQGGLEECRLDQFIFDDLSKEEMALNNRHQLFLDTYAQMAEQGCEDITRELLHAKDADMADLSLSLMDLDRGESPNWESRRINSRIQKVQNNPAMLLEDAIRTLQHLRLFYLWQLKDEQMKRLSSVRNEEEEQSCLLAIQRLSEVIVEIESVLGTSIRRK